MAVTLISHPEDQDIWTTSVYSYAPGGGGPGGGLADNVLKVGGWGDDYYSLMQVDLKNQIKTAGTVLLRLYEYPSQSFSSIGFDLYQITTSWNWQTQGTGSDRLRLWWVDQPSATLIRSALPAPAANSYYYIDITTIYNQWQSSQTPNDGIELRPTSTYGVFDFFGSSRDPTLDRQPTLITTSSAPPALTLTVQASNPDTRLGIGGITKFTVVSTKAVTVVGSPVLKLSNGGVAIFDAAASRPNLGELTFNYVVGRKQDTSDLRISNLSLPSGAVILDASGNAASLSGLDAFEFGLSINTTSPTANSVTAVASSGELHPKDTVTVTITLDRAVTVAGAPQLILSNGGVANYDSVQSDPLRGKLVFDYTVHHNQATLDLQIARFAFSGGATITDLLGNPANAPSMAGARVDLGLGVHDYRLGLDAATDIATASQVDTLAADGYGFVIQYLNHKNVTYPAASSNSTTNLPMVSVFQDSALSDTGGKGVFTTAWTPYLDPTNLADDGRSVAYDLGYSDAQQAFGAARDRAVDEPLVAVDGSRGSAIYFAIDLNPAGAPKLISENNALKGIDDYFTGLKDYQSAYAAEHQGLTYDIGIYGAGDALTSVTENNLVQYTWLSYSWLASGGETWRASGDWDIWQFQNSARQAPLYAAGTHIEIDKDYASSSVFGQWSPNLSMPAST